MDDFTYLDNWKFCRILSTEALTLLQLVAYICKVAEHLTRDSIVIYSNNLKLVRRYNGKISKSSIRAEEGMLSIIEIKWLIGKIRIGVLIEYVSRRLKAPFTFQSNQLFFLIYQYDQRVKKLENRLKIVHNKTS